MNKKDYMKTMDQKQVGGGKGPNEHIQHHDHINNNILNK